MVVFLSVLPSPDAVQSLQKGYEFIQLLISYMPQPVSALVNLVLVVLGVAQMVGVIKFIFGGGD